MSTIEERQRRLVSQFDAEIVYLLDGVAAKMDVAGLGQSLQHFRKGKEPTRPPAVTLEPTRTGLMLGLVISRPKNGKMVYDRTLGRWDFTVPIRPRGPLDAANPMHRRAAFWACDMAEALLNYAQQVKAGNAPELQPAAFPRLLVPFYTGEEQIDPVKQASNPDAVIDRTSMPGLSLVDARIAVEDFVVRSIDENMAWEDHRPVLGQMVPNPFRDMTTINIKVVNPARKILQRRNLPRADVVTQTVLDEMVHEFWVETADQDIPVEVIYDALLNPDDPVAVPTPIYTARRNMPERFLEAARDAIGPLGDVVTDADILSAIEHPQQDMSATYRSKIQICAVESLQEPPEPYGGSVLPPVNWRPVSQQKIAPAAVL
jgi:hypothetical protein